MKFKQNIVIRTSYACGVILTIYDYASFIGYLLLLLLFIFFLFSFLLNIHCKISFYVGKYITQISSTPYMWCAIA